MKARLSIVASIVVLVVLAVVLSRSPLAAAEKYPVRPVELVMPFGPGGSLDLQARALAAVAMQHLGQPFVITMKPGAGGTIGTAHVARSKPDGYTLLLTATGPMSISLQLEDTGYTKDSFIPIALLNLTPPVVAVRTDRPWKTLEDLLTHIRANPARVVYGTTSVSGLTNLANHMLLQGAGIQASLPTVPFKSVGDQLLSILKGDTEYMVQIHSGLAAYLRSNQIRALAVLSEKRFPVMPDVPTAKELGYDVVASQWMGVLAPKGTSPEVVDTIAKALGKMVKDQSFVTMATKMDIPPAFLQPAEFQEFLEREYQKYGVAIQRAGLKKK